MDAKNRAPGTTRSMSVALPCTHEGDINLEVEPVGDVCAECVAAGGRGVPLCVCLPCGHGGCGADSKNRHAVLHFQQTGHPIICSLEPGESWRWCFIDETFLD